MSLCGNLYVEMKAVLYTKKILLLFLCLFSINAWSQIEEGAAIKGKITDNAGASLPYISVKIDSLKLGTMTDSSGHFSLKNIPQGKHIITVFGFGYHKQTKHITISKSTPLTLHFKMKDEVLEMQEVTISTENKAVKEIKESGYSVNTIETKEVQNREVTINQLATRTAGIRVRESGGLGSNFNYSLDGMSGRSVRFFIDGVPLDRYGPGYAINNFPVNLIERVEIYKGVVPPQFGSDALGGVINLVSKHKKTKYLDASYSVGSFNTHRAALSTRWISDSSNFYVDAQGFYNYSDNNYYVWGKGVEVAAPNGRAVEIKTRRFHDAYRSQSGKIGIGVFDKKWADELNASFIYAGNSKEIQTGTTMASVFGEVMRTSQSFSPSLFYSKKGILGKRLNTTLFSSVSFQQSITTDTSSRLYNWQGKVIDVQPTNSERGQGGNGKSRLTLNNTNWFQQANFSYIINENHKLFANYTFDYTIRNGKDPFISNRTVSFVEPQNLRKQVSSLSYELSTLKHKLIHTVWIKNYDFKVSTVGEVYYTDALGYRPHAFNMKQYNNNWGYGYATKFDVYKNNILKFSIRKMLQIARC